MEDLASLPHEFDPWFPSVRIEDQRRDVTTFLTRFTLEFPVANGRLFPYLTGGGGVGRVTERFSIVVDPIPWIPLDPLVPESVEHPSDGINTVQFLDSSSSRRRVSTPSLAGVSCWAGVSMCGYGTASGSAWMSAGCGSFAATTPSRLR